MRRSFLAVSSATLLLLSSSPASALTVQQQLNQAIDNTLNADKAFRLDGKASVNFQLIAPPGSKKKSVLIPESLQGSIPLGSANAFPQLESGDVTANLRILYRQQTKTQNGQDKEGLVRLDSISSKTPEIAKVLKLEAPIGLEWKNIDEANYVRVKFDKITPEMRKQIPAEILDLITQWMEFAPEPATKAVDTAKETTGPFNLKIGAAGQKAPERALDIDKGMGEFYVKTVQTLRTKDGLKYRMTLGRKPDYIAKEEKLALSLVPKGDADYLKKRIAEIKKQSEQKRKDNKNFALVAVFDPKKKLLERLELAGRTEEKLENGSMQKMSFAVGVTVLPNGNWAVEKPKNTVNGQDAILAVVGRILGEKTEAPTQASPAATVDPGFEFTSLVPSAPFVGITNTFEDKIERQYSVGYPNGWTNNYDPQRDGVWILHLIGTNGIAAITGTTAAPYPDLQSFVEKQKDKLYKEVMDGSKSSLVFEEEKPIVYRLADGSEVTGRSVQFSYHDQLHGTQRMKEWNVYLKHPYQNSYVSFLAGTPAETFKENLPDLEAIMKSWKFNAR